MSNDWTEDDWAEHDAVLDENKRLRRELDEAITASNVMAKSFKLAVEQRDEARELLRAAREELKMARIQVQMAKDAIADWRVEE